MKLGDEYPDIVAKGGLGAAVQGELANLGSDLQVTGLHDQPATLPGKFPAYARIERGLRSSQVMLAAEVRRFSADFWNQGVCMAHGWFDDLSRLATAVEGWIGQKWDTARLKRECPKVEVKAQAAAFESGSEVRWTWERYVREGTGDGLDAFMQAAWANARLCQLFPFRSLWWICLSRCTGWPYFTAGLPVVRAIRDNWYQVQARQEGAVLGEGDAETAVAIVVAHLPKNCLAAVPGTAEQFEKPDPQA